MKHLPLKLAGGLTALAAVTAMAYSVSTTNSQGQSDFVQRALQTRLGDLPQHRLDAARDAVSQICLAPAGQSKQLLVNITERLSQKQAETRMTDTLLFQIIREEMQC